MTPLIFVWPYALAFWPILAWVTIPENRLFVHAKKSGALKSKQDAGTAQIIVYGTYLLIVIAIAAAFLLPAATITFRRPLVFAVGIALLIGGSLLRRHCFRVLGRHFTYAVEVSQDQPVVETGAYRLVRHPSYLAGMIMYAGWGLALTNWVSLLLLISAPAALYAHRVAIEERALSETIGEPYRAYARRTKRFVPYIY